MSSGKAKGLLLPTVLSLLFVAACWTAWFSYEKAMAFEQASKELISANSLDARWSRTLNDWLTLGLSDKTERELAHIGELQASMESLRNRAWMGCFAYLVVVLLAVAWVFLMRRDNALLALVLLIASSLALVVGLTAPAMAVTAGKEVPVVGYVVLYFESKGILSSMAALFRPGGSWLIGLPIALFSVCIPILKTLVLLAAVTPGRERRVWGVNLAHRIGRWSMADVCVVSWLLAFMATERQEFMRAELQVGIVFFASYAILSIIAAGIVEHQYERMHARCETKESLNES